MARPLPARHMTGLLPSFHESGSGDAVFTNNNFHRESQRLWLRAALSLPLEAQNNSPLLRRVKPNKLGDGRQQRGAARRRTQDVPVLVRLEERRAGVCRQLLALLVGNDRVAPAGNHEARNRVLPQLGLMLLVRVCEAGPRKHRIWVHSSEGVHPAIIAVILDRLPEDRLPRVPLRDLEEGHLHGHELLDSLLFRRFGGQRRRHRHGLLQALVLPGQLRGDHVIAAAAKDGTVEALRQPAQHDLRYRTAGAEADDAGLGDAVRVHDRRDVVRQVVPVVRRVEVGIEIHASIGGEEAAHLLRHVLAFGNERLALPEGLGAANIARVEIDDKQPSLGKALHNRVHAIHRRASANDGNDAWVLRVAIRAHVEPQAGAIVHQGARHRHVPALGEGERWKSARKHQNGFSQNGLS
eukprot:CAMPEP_0168402134 /NCGR_PEP_ID=MMETSP0228-20121227/23465_1 /TAXON_ID=133427 /ORGANISM="Protoceratium reticulatum, Strain CCCM 535 (=CCMP 1889)" /LENGTH=409 /DNA_ID=CAMNT_0008415713 /DNA_START=92 /DNA_END=1318 /DNA_ORIENTATION=+